MVVMATSHGAELVSAAVRSAILAKAPRRTVAAVAASVTSALLGATKAAQPRPTAGEPTRTQNPTEQSAEGDASPEALLTALRDARRAQRKRKKVRKRAGKEAASHADQQNVDGEPAGQTHRGEPVAPALPQEQAAPSAPCDTGVTIAVPPTAQQQPPRALSMPRGSQPLAASIPESGGSFVLPPSPTSSCAARGVAHLLANFVPLDTPVASPAPAGRQPAPTRPRPGGPYQRSRGRGK